MFKPWHFFAGTKARMVSGLKSQVFGDANYTEVKVGTDDPTAVAQNMPAGSIYYDTTNKRAFQKMDAGSTTNFRLMRADEFTKEPTGFVDPAGTTVTYDTTNRTVTLSHASGSVQFLLRGRIFSYASPWTVPTVLGGATPIAHTNANGAYYLSVNPDTLAVSFGTSAWTFDQLQICYAYKSATAQFGLREVHGLMPFPAHEEFHSTSGTFIKTATVPSGYVAVTGGGYSTSDSTQNRPAIAQQTVYDEDLASVITAWPDDGPYTLMYATASTPVFLTGQTDIFPVSGGGVAQYDVSGTLTDVTEEYYFNVLTLHLPVTADAASQVFRTVFVLGQTIYQTQAAATAAVPANWDLSGFGGVVPEFVSVLLWSFQKNQNGAQKVTKRGYARLMVDPTRYVGSRTSLTAASGISPSDHQALTNRSAAGAHPDTSITATGTYTGFLSGVTTVGGALTALDAYATGSVAGVVSTAAQTFAGTKTFNNGIIIASGQNVTAATGSNLLLNAPTGQSAQLTVAGVAVVTAAGASITLAQATTVSSGAFAVTASTTNTFGNTTDAADSVVDIKSKSTSRSYLRQYCGTAHVDISHGSTFDIEITTAKTFNITQGSSNVANCDTVGQWKFGLTTGSNCTTTLNDGANGYLTFGNSKLRGYQNLGVATAGLEIAGAARGDGTSGTVVDCASIQLWQTADSTKGGYITFNTHNGTSMTEKGRVDKTGAWTHGPSTAGDLRHIYYGSLHAKFDTGVYNIGGCSTNDSKTLTANGTSTDSLTIVVDTGNAGYFLVVTDQGSGYSAVVFVTYFSATITELADPDGIVPGTFAITKAGASLTVKVENATASSKSLAVQAIGAKITSATLTT